MDWRSFEIQEGDASSGHCDCCGTTTRRIWGYIHQDGGAPVAVFFVGWTVGKPDHGAAFDLLIGRWGESATKQDRCGVALDFVVFEGSPQFMVVDAATRIDVGNELIGSVLRRDEVIGTPIAAQVFALVDAIYMGDARLEEVRSWGRT